ncbi:MAG TPA: LD-carboxypeptidase, partial [Allocoleopsis sp.]
MKRRDFLTGLGLTIGLNKANYLSQNIRDKTIIKPVHLQIGDTIGLISPAGNIKPDDINNMKTLLINQGFKFKLGKHIFDQYGYLAGKDQDRVNDVHNMFMDDQVKAILTIRGGWGCNRILPLLDFNLISKNPKIIMGYSDITALLLAIYSQTGLITFHGAVATSTWSNFTLNYVNSLLLKREIITWKNPNDTPVETIRSGIAKGQIIGGNLSVLTSMIGSEYLPNWQNKILFVEEIGEDVYRIDRMLTQLKLAGILAQIK